jgi:hypothetical protein
MQPRLDYQTALETIPCLLVRNGPMRVCEIWRYIESCDFNIRISDNPNVKWTVIAKPLHDLCAIGMIKRLKRGLYALNPAYDFETRFTVFTKSHPPHWHKLLERKP